MRTLAILMTACGVFAAASGAAQAAKKYYVYNLTTASDFTGVYLAPAGTQDWGANQALNDSDKELQTTERLSITGIRPGRYDVKLVDAKGHTCLKRNVDLTKASTFDVRDGDLASCR